MLFKLTDQSYLRIKLKSSHRFQPYSMLLLQNFTPLLCKITYGIPVLDFLNLGSKIENLTSGGT